MARLIIQSGPRQGAQVELKPGLNRLGRQTDNDFQIDDPSVSGHHCEILLEDKSASVRDLGSTNGTYLDGQPIQSSPIRPGQTLYLGAVQMLYDAPVSIRIASVPHPPAVPTPVLPSGMSPCKNHPQQPAEWVCGRCHQLLCASCVATRNVGSKPLPFCSLCGGQCMQMGLGVFARRAEAKSFFAQFPEAFVYPFKGSGIALLIGGTLFFAFLDFLKHGPLGPRGGLSIFFMIGSLFITAISGGYLFSYLQKIVQSSAQGEESMPSWPEFSDFWADILQPFLHALAIAVFCFGPLSVFAFWSGIEFALNQTVNPGLLLGTLLAAGWAILYFPMAMLAVAMADSLTGLNPLFVIPSICKVPLEYLVACCVVLVIYAVKLAVGFVLAFLSIPLVTALLSGFLSLYFLTVEMRLLGTLYYTRKDRLNWF